jgi:predicted O-methyltransferase YrrM
MSGFVALPDTAAEGRGRRQETHWSAENLAAARAATRRLMDSEEWLFSLLPVGDGVGLGARRPARP